MKKFYLFAAIAALFAVSCTTDMTKDVECLPIGENQIFVSFEEQSDTRIQLNEECKTVWTKGDLISVFEKNRANACWRYIGATGKRNGAFIPKSSASSTQSLDKVVVVYPYNESYTISVDKRIVTTLPAEQLYHTGSYSVGDNLMVSQSDDRNFVLKSVCGWLKFQFVGTGVITKIEFSGNNYEQIAGKVRVDCTDASLDLIEDMLEDPTTDDGEVGGTLIDPEDYVTTVALNCGEEGVALNSDTVTDFYLILPPQTFESGITVKVTCADGTVVEKSTKSPLTISRNAIQPMTALTINGKPTEPATNEIWYTATKKIDPYSGEWGANLISNEWDEHTGKGVITFDGTITQIPDYAFGQGQISWMKSVNIPSGVNVIGKEAFSGMSINSGTLDEIIFAENSTLEKIGDGAFKINQAIKTIVLPNSVKEIGNSVFLGCKSFEGVILSNDYYKTWHFGTASILYSYADGHYHIVVFPSVFPDDERDLSAVGSATNIGYGAITQSNITKFSWSWIENIASYNFTICKDLTDITLDRTETIGEYVLYMCDKLTSINLPAAKEIGANCFMQNNALKTINLGCDELSNINYMGYSCPSLETIYIPSGVTSISSSFNDCAAISFLYVKAIAPPTLTDSFNSMVTATIYVPAESVKAYKSADGWKEYADAIVGYNFETGEVVEPEPKPAANEIWYTTTDGAVAEFYPSVSNITPMPTQYYNEEQNCWVVKFDESCYMSDGMPNPCGFALFTDSSNARIMTLKFSDNDRLFDFVVNGGGDWNPRLMTSLKEINVPNYVTKLDTSEYSYAGVGTFEDCSSLEAITLSDNLTVIGNNTFFGCSSLTSVTIPDTVTEIGSMAFHGCSSLKFVTLGSGLNNLKNWGVFMNCLSLEEITIPSNITEIHNETFQNCDKLHTIYCKSATPPTYGYSNLAHVNIEKIYVPASDDDSIINAYKSADGWKDYADAIEPYNF